MTEAVFQTTRIGPSIYEQIKALTDKKKATLIAWMKDKDIREFYASWNCWARMADAFTDADLMAGRWDGAALTLSAVDWTAPDVGAVTLLTGEFGEVEIKDGGFAVGLRGPTAVLEAAVVEETSPECRAQLGDRRCRVDLSGRRISAVGGTVARDSNVAVAGDDRRTGGPGGGAGTERNLARGAGDI